MGAYKRSPTWSKEGDPERDAAVRAQWRKISKDPATLTRACAPAMQQAARELTKALCDFVELGLDDLDACAGANAALGASLARQGVVAADGWYRVEDTSACAVRAARRVPFEVSYSIMYHPKNETPPWYTRYRFAGSPRSRRLARVHYKKKRKTSSFRQKCFSNARDAASTAGANATPDAYAATLPAGNEPPVETPDRSIEACSTSSTGR